MRHDFGLLCDMPLSSAASSSLEWECSHAPIMEPKLNLYSNMLPGQLLSQHFHWKHRIRTSTVHQPSAQKFISKWRAEPHRWTQAVARLSKWKYSPKRKATFADPSLARLPMPRRTRREEAAFLCRRDLFNSALLTLTHFRPAWLPTSAGQSLLATLTSPGWGDRLTGFLSSPCVESITLVDPRGGSIRACKSSTPLWGLNSTNYKAGTRGGGAPYLALPVVRPHPDVPSLLRPGMLRGDGGRGERPDPVQGGLSRRVPLLLPVPRPGAVPQAAPSRRGTPRPQRGRQPSQRDSHLPEGHRPLPLHRPSPSRDERAQEGTRLRKGMPDQRPARGADLPLPPSVTKREERMRMGQERGGWMGGGGGRGCPSFRLTIPGLGGRALPSLLGRRAQTHSGSRLGTPTRRS